MIADLTSRSQTSLKSLSHSRRMPSKTPRGQITCICLEWVEEKSGYKTFSFTNAANEEKISQRVQPPVKPVLPVLDDLRERPAESELRPLEVRIQFFRTETNFSSNPLPKLENGILRLHWLIRSGKTRGP